MILIEALVFLMTYSNPVIPPRDVCSLDASHLSAQTQIEIGIGCSTINGRKVYSDRVLEELYE